MKHIVNKLVRYCAEKDYISSEQEQWLRYGIEKRMATLFVMIPFFALACIITDLTWAVSFVLTFFYLKQFTGGYHAKSPYMCCVLSLLLEVFFLEVISAHLSLWKIIILILLSIAVIFCFAPHNHPNMHLTDKE